MNNVRAWSALVILMLVCTTLMLFNVDDAGGSIAFESDRIINKDLGTESQSSPDIVADGNDVYIFWQDRRDGNWDVFSRASHDGGLTFGQEVRVDDTMKTATLTDDLTSQMYPHAVVASDGTVHVVWSDDREGRSMIFYARSEDHGSSYSTNTKVNDHFSGTQSFPDIDVSPYDELAVVWEDTRDRPGYPQIYGSIDRGSGFEGAVKISDVTTIYKCTVPRVSFPESDRVHVTWVDDRVWDDDIYMATSLDGGDTFDPSIRISRDPTGSDQGEPDIVADQDVVHIVWRDPRSTSADIYMASSMDLGMTFTLDRCVHPNETSGYQMEPRIAMDTGGNITIAWTSSPGISDFKSDIMMTRIFSNGTFDRTYTVNEPVQGTVQDDPAVAVEDGGLGYFVWRDNRREGQTDIFFTRTTQSGEAGSGPRLEEGSVDPVMGVVDDTFHFKVTYYDVENDPPDLGFPKVNISYRTMGGSLFPYPGSPFPMTMRKSPAPDFDYRNGETYLLSLDVERELDLYFFFEARAASGNRTLVTTPVMNLPKIDQNGPTFELWEPEENEWIDRNIVRFQLLIKDDISGVDPWSVFYQTFQEEKGEWDRWQRKGDVNIIDNLTVLYDVNVTFLEGMNNLIRFRAKDMLGNGGEDEEYSISETYKVWVDATGPSVLMTSPRSGAVFNETVVSFTASITDGGIGVDPENIDVSYSVDGVDKFLPWQNLSSIKGSYEVVEDAVEIRFNLSLSFGFYNFVRVRARDLLGNSGLSANIQIVVREDQEEAGDRPPSKVSSIQPKVSGSVRPHITWSPSFDPDGDLVTYRISVYDQSSFIYIATDEEITPGNTYWDPEIDQLFVPGHLYLVEVVPESNGLKGPAANSTLIISTDANYPPDPVVDFEPKATSDRTPVISWTPAEDPDGDKVYYFIRIGRYYGGSDVLPWISVLTDTRYPILSPLQEGVYYIDLLSSDGKDFAPISHFSMSVGVYNPVLKLQRMLVVVYQDSGVTINMTVSNHGFTFDNIKIRVDGDALLRSDMEITTGANQIEVAPGSSVNTTFHVDAAKDAKVGMYSLNITITSLDGISSYTQPLTIQVVDPKDIHVGPDSDADDENGSNVQALMIVFVVLLLLIIAAMGYAYYRMDKQQREENAEIVETPRKQIPDGKTGRKELKGEKAGKKALPPKK
ncbi:MAG: hypothetical protein JXA22_00480 [Candidatus Thermoplasmatota archaeon]|nr:hypothetical protein [Candidatus Thermoplasmatota archaeon]